MRKNPFPILLSFALLLSACAPHSRAAVAPMNAQKDGAWTVFSAPEWTQNGEAVSVTAIAAATDGALWFGTAGGPAASGTGLYRFDGTNWTRYTTQNGLPADEISSLAAAPDGSLWVATFCCGTARLDKTGGWQYWKAPNDLPENDARAIAVDFQGNPWVGFAETGLARFDGQTWQTFGRGYVGQISPLADGSVLFSISEDSRPLLKRFGRDGWDTLELPSPLKESYIFDVAQTPDGALWFATEKAGLFRLTDGAWRQFTVQDGLPADSVLTLTAASDGSLWCGTPNGVARFDGQTWRVYYADKWVVSAYTAPDGRIWFGGKGEILRYEASVTSQTSFASPMPVAWQEVTLLSFDLALRFPATWQIQGSSAARGEDGFWQVETRHYPPSLYDQLSFLCVQEANDPARKAHYGENPLISDWEHGGCIVSPETPQAGLEAVLFVRHPSRPKDIFLLRGDSLHFPQILADLRFLSMPPEPIYSGYYDSPACREIPSVPAVSTQQAAGLTIVEYAIAPETCHPIQHFDGFRARVNAPGVNTNTLWKENQRKTMQAANQKLAPFGLRLEERLTAQPWPAFNLKKGQELLAGNLVRLGAVSVRADGVDFIFWAHAEDENGSQFPVLVYKNGMDIFPIGDEGFNSVWAASRLISYRYSKTKLFPVGAPANIEIIGDGQLIQIIAIPQMGPAGSPVRGLWNWEEHWVMEIRSTLFVDGEIKNRTWGYDEIFDWHLVNEKPLFAARRADRFVLVYDGQELPFTYDDIAHGDVCCETGLYDFQPLTDGALFYARRDGVWFLVRIQAAGE